MKYLLLIVLTATLFSCGNKREIVDQIRVYKDSLTVVAKQETDLSIAVAEINDKYVGQQALDSVHALEMRQSPVKAALLAKKLNFQSKIDSLELELKKY